VYGCLRTKEAKEIITPVIEKIKEFDGEVKLKSYRKRNNQEGYEYESGKKFNNADGFL